MLVFRYVDAPEAGIQVPGGVVHPGEALPEAVLREAFEESDGPDLEIVAALVHRLQPDLAGPPSAF